MKNRIWVLTLLSTGLLSAFAQPVITNQPADQTVVWGGNATFSVMATGVGPLTYQWQLNGTNLPSNLITTVAGGNLFNNQQGTNTILNNPQGCVRDSAGNVYVADTQNNVVRKLDTNGLMTIVAGNGSASFSGDGGLATNAGMWMPVGVVLDTNGNLYISDSGNTRIRKVDTNGIISTYAGGGASNPGDGGQATNALLLSTAGLALDGVGNLFFADPWRNRIRKVSTSGIITTVAGNSGIPGYGGDGSLATSATLNMPAGVAVDAAGNVFIADTYNYRIRKVNTSGVISTIAGNGTGGYTGDGSTATSARISYVNGLSVDNRGNVFIADSGNNCIRKITNNIISTVVGNGTAGFSGDDGAAASANLNTPYHVAADTNGNLYVADSGNNRVRKVGTTGVITTITGRNPNDGDPATNSVFNPWGVASDGLGNIYISDSASSRVRKVDSNGIISTYAGNGIPAFAGDGGPATNACLKWQYDLATDEAGNLFIADRSNNRVRKVDTNGVITTVAGNGIGSYSGDGGAATNAAISATSVDVDRAGNLFVAGTAGRIRKVDTNGIITTVAGNGSFSYSGDGGLATSAGIGYGIFCVRVDSAGNLYLTDVNYYRIRKVDTNGIITTVAGNGVFGSSGDGGPATNAQVGQVYGMTFDAANNLYFSDTFNQRIRKIGTNGIISTVVGTGTPGFSGDNGPAGAANISRPRNIYIDEAGDMLIADWGNNRIRQVNYLEYANQPSFTAVNVTGDTWTNLYSVVVTSASGSVTSSVVNVNLQLPPIAPAFAATNGTLQLTWSAVSNLTYQLQCATNLAAPVWENYGSPVTATNDTVSVPGIPAGHGQQFFRARWVP